MSPVFKESLRKIRRFIIKKKIKKSIGNSPINLEIGAGDRKGKIGWITIDIDENADISWDLKFGIPLNNNSVKKYTHLILWSISRTKKDRCFLMNA